MENGSGDASLAVSEDPPPPQEDAIDQPQVPPSMDRAPAKPPRESVGGPSTNNDSENNGNDCDEVNRQIGKYNSY